MNKADRKVAYSEVIGLLLSSKPKEAYNKLTLMCGSDTGLFIMADYDKHLAKLEAAKLEKEVE